MKGVLFTPTSAFDLRQIADSGQCFRINEYEQNEFIVITGSHAVSIHQDGDSYWFRCTDQEFQEVWSPYFDLDTDYSAFQARMMDDPFLRSAIETGGGIRILQQDLWETVVSFVISQRNNIPRIRSSVETLCREFGSPLGTVRGKELYAFPTAAQLRGKSLAAASLGYREAYVSELAEYEDNIWQELRSQSDAKAKSSLIAMKGIGEKVANCILLFGLHRMNSYPRDVWMNRLIDDVYHGDFDPSQYAGFAGYVQQLQFYHYRNRKFSF